MDKAGSYDEKELLAQVANGNEKAFALLMNAHWNNIYAQALAYTKSSHLAQDIVQEVFIKIWEKRAGLLTVERFESYLFILARNHILSELRKKVAQPIPAELEESFIEESERPDKKMAFKQSREAVGKAVDLLPAQQKTAFLLSREERLTHEEIASKMQLSRETVKKHICKALNFLRNYLRSEQEFMLFILLLGKLCSFW